MNWILDTLRFNGRMRCRNLVSLCHVGGDWSSETWNQPQIWPMFRPPKVRFRCLTSLIVCIPLPRGNKKHQKEPTHTDFPHEPKHVVVLTRKWGTLNAEFVSGIRRFILAMLLGAECGISFALLCFAISSPDHWMQTAHQLSLFSGKSPNHKKKLD